MELDRIKCEGYFNVKENKTQVEKNKKEAQGTFLLYMVNKVPLMQP